MAIPFDILVYLKKNYQMIMHFCKINQYMQNHLIYFFENIIQYITQVPKYRDEELVGSVFRPI